MQITRPVISYRRKINMLFLNYVAAYHFFIGISRGAKEVSRILVKVHMKIKLRFQFSRRARHREIILLCRM